MRTFYNDKPFIARCYELLIKFDKIIKLQYALTSVVACSQARSFPLADYCVSGCAYRRRVVLLIAMSFTGVTCLVGTLYLFYLLLKSARVIMNFLKATFLGGTLDFKSFGEWAGNYNVLY